MSEIRTESFSRETPRSWESIKHRIREIELESFGPRHAFTEDELRVMFNGSRSLAVLLWDGDEPGGLIGYTQAAPARRRDTYYIANTAIDNEHQGRGLVKKLMDQLYADIAARGARFIERDAAIGNGYADKIVRIHAADVLETLDHGSPYGPQRFIRMRVPVPVRKWSGPRGP